MIATSTTFLNSLLNSKAEEKTSNANLDKDQTLFYNLIKASLNTLVKEPKQQSIDKILAFSKSL